MNGRGQRSENDTAPVSLFIPDDDALGDVHCMSFKDGVLTYCRIVRPNWIDGVRWLIEHCK